jgi:hypothetical protein
VMRLTRLREARGAGVGAVMFSANAMKNDAVAAWTSATAEGASDAADARREHYT